MCDFLQTRLLMSREEAVGEATLYVTQPGYACAGLLGWDELRRMKEEEEEEEEEEEGGWEGLLRHGMLPPVYVRYLEGERRKVGGV